MNIDKTARNAQYTFKYNKDIGRHGWLRLTPAYSIKIIHEIVDTLTYLPSCVLDPFSGTATTPLECSYKNIPALSLEINPFLTWFGNAKMEKYPRSHLDEANKLSHHFISKILTGLAKESALPPIYNIERWWGKKQLSFLSQLKSEIISLSDGKSKDLMLIAFCRTIIEISNAAFNHVSTSFKDGDIDDNCTTEHFCQQFLDIVQMVTQTANIQPDIIGNVILNDSRSIPEQLNNKFDTVITSPPYPNRISYIRELRPYMYWLDYLTTPTEASDIDWESIGGTWGSATSKLAQWESDMTNALPQYLFDLTNEIALKENKSGRLMANYVIKYFDDIYKHLSSVYNSICDGGSVHYIIGNSSFYGVTIPAEEVYEDIMKQIGYSDTSVKIIRKRNSKKELFEYIVSARKT